MKENFFDYETKKKKIVKLLNYKNNIISIFFIPFFY